MRNTPIGLMADIAKRNQSRQGAELANAACASIIKATQIIPDMPRSKHLTANDLVPTSADHSMYAQD